MRHERDELDARIYRLFLADAGREPLPLMVDALFGLAALREQALAPEERMGLERLLGKLDDA